MGHLEARSPVLAGLCDLALAVEDDRHGRVALVARHGVPGAIGTALKEAGYPEKAKPITFMSGQWWKVVAILWVLMIYVTMVYGPIAAMLVEFFPTRIRYTSMSLPYHIGNGWFGGFLPVTSFAIVAATMMGYHRPLYMLPVEATIANQVVGNMPPNQPLPKWYGTLIDV